MLRALCRNDGAQPRVGIGCAPCQGGALQWVQLPPGNRSSPKQPEQLWSNEMAEAFG
jgi:hypothetical protein